MTENIPRVVVTGLGLVTPLGISIDENWGALMEGKSGVGPVTRFDSSRLPAKICGEVKDFDSEKYISKKEARKMDTFIQYVIAATSMAFTDSCLNTEDKESERWGAIIGVGLGGLPSIEANKELIQEKGPGRLSPFFIPTLLANLAAGQVSIRWGLKGPNSCTVTACASGNHAIGDSMKCIQRGIADVMVSGGGESCITELGMGGFCAMKALSCRNDEPELASRPFDSERDGFVMGEGSGILILENYDHAVARGANIYAELVGYGLTSDAYHITSPDPNGYGASRCMKMALDDAGLEPDVVDYINAHGTSTPTGDRLETAAIKNTFGDHATQLAVSSTKSMTGHLLGAAGGVESVYTVLAINKGCIPPTINYENPDADCDLDYVANSPRKANVNIALTNSFGFGGTNATLLFKKVE